MGGKVRIIKTWRESRTTTEY